MFSKIYMKLKIIATIVELLAALLIVFAMLRLLLSCQPVKPNHVPIQPTHVSQSTPKTINIVFKVDDRKPVVFRSTTSTEPLLTPKPISSIGTEGTEDISTTPSTQDFETLTVIQPNLQENAIPLPKSVLGSQKGESSKKKTVKKRR